MRTGASDSQRRLGARAVLSIGTVALTLLGSARAGDEDSALKLRSSTFVDGGLLPLSAINNFPGTQGMNVCTADGRPGGNESPELSWIHAPDDTKSFVVIMYDVTASFTHWGMYNIPASTSTLPMNAGVAGSAFGSQVFNDYGDMSYDGPCPPPNLTPTVHQYVITVYALDKQLQLGQGDFRGEAGADGLFRALLDASRHEHILASASITGLFSSAP
jgi:Raf kinase inhibitor-like YbhB/YbcL family protein